MKDFDLCYFIWRILYKNEITLTINSFNLNIQIFGHVKTNICADELEIIIAQLLIQDISENDIKIVIDKPDYKEYLECLRQSEIILRNNSEEEKEVLLPKLLNEDLVSYLINFIYEMLRQYQSCPNDNEKLIELTKNSMKSSEFKMVNYMEMPHFYVINLFYKYLFTAYREKKRFEVAANSISNTQSFFMAQIKKYEELCNNGIKPDDIIAIIEKDSSQFYSEIDNISQELSESLDDYNFFGRKFR